MVHSAYSSPISESADSHTGFAKASWRSIYDGVKQKLQTLGLVLGECKQKVVMWLFCVCLVRQSNHYEHKKKVEVRGSVKW